MGPPLPGGQSTRLKTSTSDVLPIGLVIPDSRWENTPIQSLSMLKWLVTLEQMPKSAMLCSPHFKLEGQRSLAIWLFCTSFRLKEQTRSSRSLPMTTWALEAASISAPITSDGSSGSQEA